MVMLAMMQLMLQKLHWCESITCGDWPQDIFPS
jgi:hypothetical protein